MSSTSCPVTSNVHAEKSGEGKRRVEEGRGGEWRVKYSACSLRPSADEIYCCNAI